MIDAARLPVTARQQEVLDFVRSFLRQHGYPPTVREIAIALGVSSPNGVICHLTALERKGHLQRDPQTARGIRIDGFQQPHGPFALSVRGKVHAGGLVEVFEDEWPLDWWDLFGDPADFFALLVEGNGWRSTRLIRDGDWLIVREDDPDPARPVGVVRRVGS